MSEASISQVRSFNRLVAERVGAVGEDFLGRKRTLGESRILWEIGPDGIDVRALETSVELRRRDVASPDDTRGLRHRLVTAQLSPHTARPLPIELHAHVEPSA